MKAWIQIFLAITIFSGCDQTAKKEQSTDDSSTTVRAKTSATNARNGSLDIGDLNQLIPIDTINSESSDAFKKYGLEFNGNCYACDLANVSITEKSVALTNVCDEKTTQTFGLLQSSDTGPGIEFKTKEFNFILTEIDKAPIYELKIVGKGLKNESLRLSRYYTLKKLLNRFEQHDCGDFEG